MSGSWTRAPRAAHLQRVGTARDVRHLERHANAAGERRSPCEARDRCLSCTGSDARWARSPARWEGSTPSCSRRGSARTPPAIRERVCRDGAWLGSISTRRPIEAGGPRISTSGSRVQCLDDPDQRRADDRAPHPPLAVVRVRPVDDDAAHIQITSASVFRFERGLRPRTPDLGGGSEGGRSPPPSGVRRLGSGRSRFDEVRALVSEVKWDGKAADRMGFGFIRQGEIPADEMYVALVLGAGPARLRAREAADRSRRSPAVGRHASRSRGRVRREAGHPLCLWRRLLAR